MEGGRSAEGDWVVKTEEWELCIDDNSPANSESEAEEAEETATSPPTPSRRQCHKCGRLLSDAKALKHHLLRRKTPCNARVDTRCCGNDWRSAKRLLSHQASSNCALFPKARPSRRRVLEADLTCGRCGKVFACRANLRGHEAGGHCGHTRRMRAARLLGKQCERCGRLFASPRRLAKHLARQRPCLDRSRLLDCPRCGRGLASLASLRSHLASPRACVPPPAVPEPPKPVRCPRCQRLFRRQSKMEHHLKLRLPHCVDPDFLSCCGNTFSSLIAVTRHRRTFHGGLTAPQPPTSHSLPPSL